MEKEVLERITKIFFKNNEFINVTDEVIAKGKPYLNSLKSLLPHYPSLNAMEYNEKLVSDVSRMLNQDASYLMRKYLNENIKFRITRINTDIVPDKYLTIYDVQCQNAYRLMELEEDVRYEELKDDTRYYWISFENRPLNQNEKILEIVPKWWKDVKFWKE